MNPVKAGYCLEPDQYPYSSAREYLSGVSGLTDMALIRGILNERGLKEFVYQENNDQCMEIDEKIVKRVTDEAALQMIGRELGSLSCANGKVRERQSLNASINQLIKAGVSIRQMSRLTWMSRKVIESAVR